MSRKPGTPKTGGRTAGTLNKKTIIKKQLIEVFEERGFCPGEVWTDAVNARDFELAQVVRSVFDYVWPRKVAKEQSEAVGTHFIINKLDGATIEMGIKAVEEAKPEPKEGLDWKDP